MVEAPFASGVVAAFIFLIFELLIFPVLIYSTSSAAAVLLRSEAEKGHDIRVESMKFPLWSDGLLHHQWSHKLLLLLRIVFIAIPVYLETGLEPRRVFNPVTRNIENAFVVAPKRDWIEYANEWQSDIHNLFVQSEIVFDHCSRVNEDGWLTATVANVTGRSNSRELVHCIKETRTPVYRSVPNVDALENPLKYEHVLRLGITWIVGPREVFPNSSIADSVDSDDLVCRIENVTVLDTQGIECATNSITMFSTSHLYGMTGWEFMCEKVTGNVTEFYGTKDLNYTSNRNYTSTPQENGVNRNSSGQIRTTKATIELRTYYVEKLQFNETRITAAQWINANSLHPEQQTLGLASFYDTLRYSLYTRASNVTVEVDGDESGRTEIGNLIVVLGLADAVVVLLFGLITLMYSRLNRKDIQMPNTLNGLSELWAQSTSLLEYDMEKCSRVNLRLSMGCDGEKKAFLEPATIVRHD